MELVYSFATLVLLDGMNGVIAQKTKHESQTYALKMGRYTLWNLKHTPSLIYGINIRKEGPQMRPTALATPIEQDSVGYSFPSSR